MGFPLEVLTESFCGNFNGDDAIKACIACLPDLSHTASSDGREDLLRN